MANMVGMANITGMVNMAHMGLLANHNAFQKMIFSKERKHLEFRMFCTLLEHLRC